MWIYIINLITVPIYNLIFKNKKTFIFVVSIQLLLILFFRNEELGVDVSDYKLYYYTWQQLSFREILNGFSFFGNAKVPWGTDSGYVIFNWIISQSHLSFKGLTFAIDLIFIISLAFFANDNVKKPWIFYYLVISFGVFSNAFCILRQTMAFSILLWSFKYLKKNKIFKFILICLIASLFHKTALLFILFLLVKYIKINRSIILLTAILMVMELLFFTTAYSYIFSPLLNGFLGKMYAIGEMKIANIFWVLLVLFFAETHYYFSFTSKHNFNTDSNNKIFFFSIALALIVEILSFYISTFSRAALFLLLPINYVFIANFVANSKRKNVISAFVVIIGLLFMIYSLNGTKLGIVPYIPISFKN